MLNKLFTLLFLFLISVTLPFLQVAVAASDQQDQSHAIIYEYSYFTQKKGESIVDALKKTQLSDDIKKIVEDIPIASKVTVDRIFRLAFGVEGSVRTLREINVEQQDRMVNFILAHKNEHVVYRSAASQIKPEQVAANLNKQIYFIQKKGQTIADALKVVPLSRQMRQLVTQLPVIKSAKTDRQFHLRFKGDDYKIIDVVKVIRGTNTAEYKLLQTKGKYTWKEGYNLLETAYSDYLNQSNDREKQEYLALATSKNRLALATTEKNQVTRPVAEKTVKASPSVTSPPVKRDQTSLSGNYVSLKILQKKGQSYNKVILGSRKFSSLQKQLLDSLPIYKKARSDRYFYFLFKKEGSRKLMRAVRVVRGSSQAAFGLVNINNDWRWVNSSGGVDVASTFLRIPVHYKRVSSRFNLHRRHPVTHRIRPHKGVDLAAKHGEPVWAPANGVVTFAGKQRGYGNVVVINHQNGYITKYAHLSKILVRRGQHVRQKKVIGKVGSTGMSTGSHLHYEILVNHVPKDPLSVKLPAKINKVTTADKKQVRAYLAELKRLSN